MRKFSICACTFTEGIDIAPLSLPCPYHGQAFSFAVEILESVFPPRNKCDLTAQHVDSFFIFFFRHISLRQHEKAPFKQQDRSNLSKPPSTTNLRAPRALWNAFVQGCLPPKPLRTKATTTKTPFFDRVLAHDGGFLHRSSSHKTGATTKHRNALKVSSLRTALWTTLWPRV